MRRSGPGAMKTAAPDKHVALGGDRKEQVMDEKDDTTQLPVATAYPIDVYDIPMGDLAIAALAEPATAVQQLDMTSCSAGTKAGETRHSKPAAATKDPDATNDYADVPEDDFKESVQAMIARMPDLPTGLETPQQDMEEEDNEEEVDESSMKLYAS